LFYNFDFSGFRAGLVRAKTCFYHPENPLIIRFLLRKTIFCCGDKIFVINFFAFCTVIKKENNTTRMQKEKKNTEKYKKSLTFVTLVLL
jgi:hypothetical protein